MNTASQITRSNTNIRTRGFALVIALGLMAFVLLLLLSITTLVQVETASAQTASRRLEAEQNALLGLNIALGNLQKLAGPDQRATATADILSDDSYSFAQTPAAQEAQRWTGVWDSTQDRDGGFLGWLVSNPNLALGAPDLADASTLPASRVTLLGSGTLGEDMVAGDEVEAPLVEIEGHGNTTGEFAYWIGDEGVKAKLQGKRPSDDSSFSSVARKRADFRLNQRNAIEVYGGGAVGAVFPAEFSEQSRSERFNDLFLLSDSPLSAAPANLDKNLRGAYFDFTPYNVGLLTDSKHGGWKKDLTWLFEQSAASSELNSIDANPGFPGSQISGEWPANAARSHWPAPPSWELLKDYYRLSNSTSPLECRPHSGDTQGIAPAITHYAISFIPGLNGVFNDNATPESNDDYFKGYLRMYVDIRIAMWNPYDVAITLPESDLEILWREESEGVSTDMKMYFGNIALSGDGSASGGASHTGSMISSFVGSGGRAFLNLTMFSMTAVTILMGFRSVSRGRHLGQARLSFLRFQISRTIRFIQG